MARRGEITNSCCSDEDGESVSVTKVLISWECERGEWT